MILRSKDYRRHDQVPTTSLDFFNFAAMLFTRLSKALTAMAFTLGKQRIITNAAANRT
jgi:hypothetical protein